VGRLAALVPPPRVHLTRYFGVFAPRAKLRRTVVPQCTDEDDGCAHSPVTTDTPKMRARRYSWSRLLARVFAVDVLVCPRCASRMQTVEWVTHPERIQAVLNATGPPGDLEAAA